MAIPTNQAASTKFNLVPATPKIEFTDTTGWVSEGFALAEILEIFKMVAPTVGIIHENTNFGAPDINRGATDFFGSVNVPLTTETVPQPLSGTYAITQNIQATKAITVVAQGPKTFTVAGNITASLPTGYSFTITGSTGNDGTYTVASASDVAATTEIIVNEAIPSAVADGNIVMLFTKTFSYTYGASNFSLPTILIEQDTDCLQETFASNDTTDYTGFLTSITRAHTVRPPISLGADVTLDSPTNPWSPIANGPFETDLTSTVSFTFADGLLMDAVLNGIKSSIVDCDLNLNQIFGCLSNLYDNYYAKKNIDKTGADELFAVIQEWETAITMMNLAISAGDATKAAEYQAQVVAISGCTADCAL